MAARGLSWRLPATPVEESAAARAFAWAGIAVAAAAIAVYGQSYLVPPLAVAVAAWGHRDSYRRRQQPRGGARQAVLAVLVTLSFVYLALDSTQAVFGGQLPQAHFALLLLAVTSFDLKTRRNLYSSLWITLALLYLAGVLAWDFSFGAFCVAWLACLAGFWVASYLGRQQAARLDLPRRPALVLGAGTLAGGVLAFALLPQPSLLPATPLVISLPSNLRFQGTLEAPVLPLIAASSGGSAAGSIDLHFRGALGDQVVMYVRTGAPAYWRGQVLDKYRNGAWTSSNTALSLDPGYVGPNSLPPPEGPVRGTFLQVVHVVRPLPNVIYAAAPVASLYFPNTEVARDAYGGWRTPGPLQPGQTYSAVSYLPDLSPALLRPAVTDPDTIPGIDYDPAALAARGRPLAQAIVAGVPDDAYDQVAAMTAYLQRHYHYSQRIPPVPAGRDPVDWFLFDSRTGYCEQFASAEVLLLRSLGIPARLATGYSTGDYNPVLDQAVVREHDAHAWVEAYFGGHGWVPFDPSPGFAELPAGQLLDRWAVSGLGALVPHIQLGAARLGAELGWAGLPLLLPVLLVLGLLIWRRSGFRVPTGRSVWRRARTPSELMALYERVQRRLPRRRGLAETPFEYWRAVAPEATSLLELTRAVNEEAYAGRAASRERVEELRRRLTPG